MDDDAVVRCRALTLRGRQPPCCHQKYQRPVQAVGLLIRIGGDRRQPEPGALILMIHPERPDEERARASSRRPSRFATALWLMDAAAFDVLLSSPVWRPLPRHYMAPAPNFS